MPKTFKYTNMKYIIKLQHGEYVEKFWKNAVIITSDLKRAGTYTKRIANERLDKQNIQGELINSNYIIIVRN